jgi:outer membrane lipase/esterase
MPRIRHLTAAVVLGLAANAAQAQSFSGVISFGDSLSDAGNYAPFIPGAGSFTTNPDDVWTQILAQAYGSTQTAFTTGGSNFAFGGAPTADLVNGLPMPCVPNTLPCQSVGEQLGIYLAANGGQADPNALYTYWAGANDIFDYLGYVQAGILNTTTVQTAVGASALTAVGQIGALQNAGANYIVVLNLPDIGRTPAFAGGPASTSVSGLVTVYNTTLNNALATLGDGIIPVNAYGLVNEVLASPGAYGFTNVTGTACNLALTGGTSLFCTPGAYVTPDANETYFFADGVHPTGAAHRILAQAVVAEIAAPGQVSMLGEFALRAGAAHDDAVRSYMFNADDDSRSDDSVRGFANVMVGRVDFDATAWTPDSDATQVTLIGGADYRFNEHWRWGGAVSATSQRIDIATADVDGMAVNGSLYLVRDFEHGYIGATVGGGNNSFDIDRHIQLGNMDRVETSNADAQRWMVSVGGAWVIDSGSFRHGPFIDVTWQDLDVEAFAEDSGDSTAMTFDGYNRDSLVGRIGWQFTGTGDGVRPFGRVAYNAENEDDQVMVRAGLVSMNGHFVMPGWQPTDNWWSAELGVGFRFSDTVRGMASYSGLFGDDLQDHNQLNLGVQVDFGAAQPVVEPVADEPAPVECSSLDDDGDGVNNCDDRCPDTAAGEAIGADGCPMPVTEPEEAPKAFRN